jgi:opacity protein-like surface antigen
MPADSKRNDGMVRARLLISSLVGLCLMTASAAHAADYPLPPPPVYVAPQECCTDNWYLRGYVGVGLAGGDGAQYIQNSQNSSNFAFDSTSYSDHNFLGLGFGYEVNAWLRVEATAEYRAKSRIYAFGHYTFGGGTFLDTYEGNLDSWVFLGNAFVDLGTWNCFTPFIGFGIGGAYTNLADFTDINPSLAGFGIGRDTGEWNLAWALYAGVSYEVTKNFSVDLSYRYLNYGSITDTVDCFGGCNADSFKFDNLYSHDFMLSLRWTCCELPAPPPPPPPRYVYTPPPPVYAPPPPPPPLRSRG